MSKTDYLLTIDSVQGEYKRANGRPDIEVISFEFSADSPHDTRTGKATGKRRYSDVTITKLLDRASPVLQTMLAQNAKIKTATLTCYKAGDPGGSLKYYEITWSDVFVSSYRLRGQFVGDEFGAIPREEFTLNFRKVEVNYMVQTSQGSSGGNTSFSDVLSEETVRSGANG